MRKLLLPTQSGTRSFRSARCYVPLLAEEHLTLVLRIGKIVSLVLSSDELGARCCKSMFVERVEEPYTRAVTEEAAGNGAVGSAMACWTSER
jgi:hypothetical protein